MGEPTGETAQTPSSQNDNTPEYGITFLGDQLQRNTAARWLMIRSIDHSSPTCNLSVGLAGEGKTGFCNSINSERSRCTNKRKARITHGAPIITGTHKGYRTYHTINTRQFPEVNICSNNFTYRSQVGGDKSRHFSKLISYIRSSRGCLKTHSTLDSNSAQPRHITPHRGRETCRVKSI